MSDNPIILVEFDDDESSSLDSGSMQQVSRGKLNAIADKSRAAVENSLRTIEWVGGELKTILDNMHEQPDEVELEFGIKVSTEAGILVKGKGDFHIKAKLVWKKDADSSTDNSNEESVDNGA